MKRLKLYLNIVVGSLLFLTACSDTEVINTGDIDGTLNIIYTTPTLSYGLIPSEPAYTETRGTHSVEEAKVTEDKIESLHVLFFDKADADGKLLKAVKSTLKNPGQATIEVSAYKTVYVRLVANIDATGWEGQTWSALQQNKQFVFVSSASSYPMSADVGLMDVRQMRNIGTIDEPVKLIRSVAKISVENNASSDFVFKGFRTFQINNKGYVFPQSPFVHNAEFVAFDEEVSSYENGKAQVFLPETEGTETNQTFVIIKASYKGVEGYYRIDVRDKDGNLIPVSRNMHYLIRLGDDIGYGYSSETEALLDPYNDEGKSVEVIAFGTYDHIYNSNMNFVSFTNSTVVIYGKAEYYIDHYARGKKSYPYVITMLQTEKESIIPQDVEILDNGGLNVSVNLPRQGDNEEERPMDYLVVTTEAKGLTKGEVRYVKLRYKNMVKTIKVVWMGEYIDCTYWNLPLVLDGKPLRCSYAELRSHTNEKGLESTNEGFQSWIGLSVSEGNANYALEGDVSKFLSKRIEDHIGTKYVQFRENLSYLSRKLSEISGEPEYFGEDDWEGFRFIDIYAGGFNGEGTVKYIFAQASADLSGFFGNDNLIEGGNASDKIGNYDDPGIYNRYLLTERVTDTYITGGAANLKTLDEYCKKINPSDKRVWYIPTYKQLLGLWVTDNSNSRRTSPFQTEEMKSSSGSYSPAFSYFSRLNYSASHISNYSRSNEGLSSAVHTDNIPYVGFLYGETQRGMHEKTGQYIGIRAVRNLDKVRTATNTDIEYDPSVKAVDGNTITIDPLGILSNNYFENEDQDPSVKNNKVARKFQVHSSKIGSQTIYKWTWSSGTSYTRSSRTSQEGESTWAEAKSGASGLSQRLPTMRELALMYIFREQLQENTAFYPFNADIADASGETTDVSKVTKYPLIMRYPAATGKWAAPMYWYWSSSYVDIDGGQPLRMSMDLGAVNRRGGENDSGQKAERDHYRSVKTVE